MKASAAVVALLLVASVARAQTIEVTALFNGGYTAAAGIDKKAAGVQDLEVAGGFTWGAQAAYIAADRVGIEVFWSQQLTHLRLTTSSGVASLFDMKVGVLHGNVVYHAADRGDKLQPFLFAGLGSTFFTADDLQRETKLSLGVGGGLEWFPREPFGLRLHARFTPTHLNASASNYCDPFGFCQGWLTQFELAGGLALRF